jgi:hypothetical protein
MSFPEWLAAQVCRTDAVGRLARKSILDAAILTSDILLLHQAMTEWAARPRACDLQTPQAQTPQAQPAGPFAG